MSDDMLANPHYGELDLLGDDFPEAPLPNGGEYQDLKIERVILSMTYYKGSGTIHLLKTDKHGDMFEDKEPRRILQDGRINMNLYYTEKRDMSTPIKPIAAVMAIYYMTGKFIEPRNIAYKDGDRTNIKWANLGVRNDRILKTQIREIEKGKNKTRLTQYREKIIRLENEIDTLKQTIRGLKNLHRFEVERLKVDIKLGRLKMKEREAFIEMCKKDYGIDFPEPSPTGEYFEPTPALSYEVNGDKVVNTEELKGIQPPPPPAD